MRLQKILLTNVGRLKLLTIRPNSQGFHIWDTANQCYVLADIDAIENVISQERARKEKN